VLSETGEVNTDSILSAVSLFSGLEEFLHDEDVKIPVQTLRKPIRVRH